MNRELSEIAEQLASILKNKMLIETQNPNDFISNKVREKLQEVDQNSKHYLCEDCGFVVNNKVFKHAHGICENCGNKLLPFDENDYNQLFETELLTCPECDSKLPRIYKESQNECPVCGKYMDVFIPMHNKYKTKNKA